uniref:Uncharacterized protein n=1 Tax=Romanomermis culicivorax TaxID=13658 RepID=A0A915KBP3_ROMCU
MYGKILCAFFMAIFCNVIIDGQSRIPILAPYGRRVPLAGHSSSLDMTLKNLNANDKSPMVEKSTPLTTNNDWKKYGATTTPKSRRLGGEATLKTIVNVKDRRNGIDTLNSTLMT